MVNSPVSVPKTTRNDFGSCTLNRRIDPANQNMWLLSTSLHKKSIIFETINPIEPKFEDRPKTPFTHRGRSAVTPEKCNLAAVSHIEFLKIAMTS